jgi:hypothetical protein
MSNDEVELWLTAFRLLAHDRRALASLLKSGMPVPPGIAYLLGELLVPSDPPLLELRVEPKRTKTLGKALNKLNATREYKHRLSSGQSSQDAAADIGERYGVSDRHVYRWLGEDVPTQFKARIADLTDKISFENVSDRSPRVAHHDSSANNLIIGAMSLPG